MEKRHFISVKTKLLGIILPVVMVIIIVLTSLSYYVSRDVIRSNTQDLLETSVQSQAAEIEAWLSQNLTSFQVEKHALEWMGFDDKQFQDFLDAYYGYDSNYPEGFYAADADGALYKGQSVTRVQKNVVLREPDENGNYLINGGMLDEDLAEEKGWQLLTALEGEAEAEIGNGELAVRVSNEGTADYSIQLVQAGLPVQRKGKYQISFEAYADAPRMIKVSVTAPDRSYQRYLNDTEVELTKEKQLFSYEFTMEDSDDANGRLEFNMGAMGSTQSVYISNVSMIKTGEASSAGQEDGQDVTQTEWFREGLTRVNMGFTNAYMNEEGKQVISACGMLRNDEGKVRVLSADLSLDKVSVYVNSFIKMKDAEAFLVNLADDTILASRDTSLILKKLEDMEDSFLKAAADRILDNNLEMAEIDGNMTVFEKVEGTEWLLVSYVPTSTVYKDLDHIRNIMILFGMISLLMLFVLIERIIHIVIRPVKGLTDVIRAMTDGDFTIRIQTKSHDEIGIMSRCVEKFIASMREMIASIHGVTNALHDQADSGSDVSRQMFDASQKQSMSMKNLNATVEQLSVSVNEIAKNATTLAMVVTETKENGNHVDSRMKETIDISQKGKNDMAYVSEAMRTIDQSVKKLQYAIDEVGKVSEEITNITRVIGDIADETNLLSLNASIEAARAGEAGKGFTVVAAEIGKLAQTSMESVKHIDQLVSKIKTSVGDVVVQANESVGNIHDSNDMIQNAMLTFDQIFNNIQIVGDLVGQMMQKVDHVDHVANDVAAISEEQAASSQQILSASDTLVEQADNLMANSESVAEDAKELIYSAEQLTEQIGIFKINHTGL